MNNNIQGLIEDFKGMKINLWVKDGNLHYKAPDGAMTKEVISQLKANKQEIIAYLSEKKGQAVLTINEKDRYKPFPLTDVQSAYLLGRKNIFQYGGVACHLYMELSYENLDRERVEKVWQQLIVRHDMLRAVMNENGFQTVLEEMPDFKVPLITLSHLSDAEKEEKLKDIRETLGKRLFEIGSAPMFEVVLSQDVNETIMHFSIEFLIADWTSIWMLLKEFEALYFNKVSSLPAIPITFRDYLLKEQELKESAKYEEDKAYWLNKIDTMNLAPILPMKRGKEQEDQPAFERHDLTIPPQKWQAFLKSAKKNNVTPTAAILCVYTEVLRKWSQNKDFVINLTVLNRLPLHEDIGKVVGDFTSISLLNVQDNEDKHFTHQTARINESLFTDMDHTLFSGIEVIREITRRKGKEAALMPYVFTSAVGLIGDQAGDLVGKFNGYGISQTPQVFIDCQATDGAFGLKVNWDVRKNIFPEGMIEDMFFIFKEKLMALAENESSWDQEMTIEIPKWQLEERLEKNNTDKEIVPSLMYTPFLANVKANPDKTAVIDSEGQFTYKELHLLALQVAGQIAKHGGKKGDKIAILIDKSRYQAAAALGVLYAGCTYVPIDGKQATQRRQNIIKKAAIKQALVLSTQEFKDLSVQNIAIDQLPLEENDFNIIDRAPHTPAYIIFTSGTTGEPKGVVISHASAMNTILDINERFKLSSKDNVIGLSQLTFDLSVYDLFGTLSFGGTLVYPEVQKYLDPVYIDGLINQYEISVWNSVPAFMQMYADYLKATKTLKETSLRLVMLSGDWIPLNMPGVLKHYIKDLTFVSLGGATEAAIWSNIYEVNDIEPQWISIPYGHPLTNQTLFVLDQEMKPCPVWVEGDFYIGGKGLALGYLEDEEKTNEKFITWEGQRLYNTGDRCRYMPGGEIEFLGRKDNQVKIRGHRIELGEIQYAIEQIQGVSSAAVLLDQHGELSAVIEPAKNEGYQEETAKKAFFDRLCALNKNLAIGEDLSINEITRAIETRDEVALIAMLHGLQSLGFLHKGRKYKMEDILNSGLIHEKHKWLIKHWLLRLAQSQYVNALENGEYEATKDITPAYMEEAWEKAYASWTDKFGSVDFIDYIKVNADHITELIKGEADAVSLLYPEGSLKYTKALYANNIIVKYINQCIADFVENFLIDHQGEEIRILEVGAGTGSTATPVLSQIEEKGYTFNYYFTDALKYFLPAAKANFGKYDNVSFHAFNLDEDYRSQGFKPNSFDIIIGAYVLENAKDIKQSIVHVKELLKAGGYFIFSEPVRDEAWIMESQGFMMMAPADHLRDHATFIGTKEWCQALESVDKGSEVGILPTEDSNLSHMGISLFIKQFKGELYQLDEAALRKELKDYLPEYMIPKHLQIVDHLPLTANGKVDMKTMKSWEIHVDDSQTVKGEEETNSNSIEAALTDIWKETLNIESIGRKQNFYDFGADSLIMAQVATKIRNKITNQIPFDSILHELLNEPTIEQTAEFIKAQQSSDTTSEAASEHLGKIRDFGGEDDKELCVLLHGAFGTIGNLEGLAQALSQNAKRRVIGIEVADYSKYMAIDASKMVPTLADQYLDLILKEKPEKVQLIGYSYGGLIAVELAERLTEQGIEVVNLSLIDSIIVPYKILDVQMQELIFLNNFNVSLADLGSDDIKAYDEAFEKKALEGNDIENGYLCHLNGNEKQERLAAFFRNLAEEEETAHWTKYAEICFKKSMLKIEPMALKKMFANFTKAFEAMTYVPEIYMGDIDFYYAKEATGMYKYKPVLLKKWEDICLGELQVIEIPGDHYTCVEGENAKALSEKMKEVDR